MLKLIFKWYLKIVNLFRVGKNNVMLVCVPNPPINPKEGGNEPVGMLIRWAFLYNPPINPKEGGNEPVGLLIR